MAKYIFDYVDGIFGYCPLMLYAVNKEVHFVPHGTTLLLLNETSVTDNYWSIREENQ